MGRIADALARAASEQTDATRMADADRTTGADRMTDADRRDRKSVV